MLNEALDQIRKLFGRGFLFSAFVPGFLFAVLAAGLWWGPAKVAERLHGLAKGDLKEAGLALLAALVGVYLFAYVLYGLRGPLLRVYQGEWTAWYARWFAKLEIALFARVWRRWRNDLERRDVALTDAVWPDKFGFDQTAAAEQLDGGEHVRQIVQGAKALHNQIVGWLQAYEKRTGRKCPKLEGKWERRYQRLLADGRLLRGNRDGLPDGFKTDINSLVKDMADAYKRYPALPATRAALYDATLAERDLPYDRLVRQLPKTERFLRPTWLGNVTAAMELHTFDRYGIYLGAVWPRLRHVLSADARERLEDSTIFIDFAVAMSVLSLALLCLALLPVQATADGTETLSPLLRRVAALLFLVGFYGFYRTAVQATYEFAVQVQSCIDLYRLKLLDALSIERAVTMEEEKTIWTELKLFILRGDTSLPHVRLKVAAAPADAKKEAKPEVPPPEG